MAPCSFDFSIIACGMGKVNRAQTLLLYASLLRHSTVPVSTQPGCLLGSVTSFPYVALKLVVARRLCHWTMPVTWCKNRADGLRAKLAQTFRVGLEEPALDHFAPSTACFTAVRSRQGANISTAYPVAYWPGGQQRSPKWPMSCCQQCGILVARDLGRSVDESCSC
jgi:hypothetical protein